MLRCHCAQFFQPRAPFGYSRISTPFPGEILAGQRLAIFNLALQFGATRGHPIIGVLHAQSLRFIDLLAQPSLLLRRGHWQAGGAAAFDRAVDALSCQRAARFDPALTHLVNAAECLTQFFRRINRPIDHHRRNRGGSGIRLPHHRHRSRSRSNGRMRAGQAGPDFMR